MVVASISFINPLDRYETEKPFFLNIPGFESTSTLLRSNLEFSPYNGIQIDDMRERGLDAFSLEEDGFKVLNYKAVSDPQAGDAAVVAYCDELVRLVSEECKAAYAICYDYRFRRGDLGLVAYEKDLNTGRTSVAPPVFPAHIDHTVDGGPKRIRRHLTEEELTTYLGGRFRARIINVWRPLNRVVEDCPIAICHPASIDPHDLLATDRVTPDFAVEMYHLKHRPGQKWYWLRDQAPEELMVFVNYDSICHTAGSKWMACPHAAFTNPEARGGALPRESIEARLIVFSPLD